MSVLTDQLEEHAALYASGALTTRERAQFEIILKHHAELRALVKRLEEAAVGAGFPKPCGNHKPSEALKARLLIEVQTRAQRSPEEAFVMANAEGLVEWVNPAFTGMCGYTLVEVKGKKLGSILQGALTDPVAAARVRDAVEERRPCTEALINYRKDGTPYWVSINITPIEDDAGHFLCFIAREHELPERYVHVTEN
jgi:PAS domain S-box-containing protein